MVTEGITPNDQPKHITEALDSAAKPVVHGQGRAEELKRRDLTSERDGLQIDRELASEMEAAYPGSINPTVSEGLTHDQLATEADLQDLPRN